MSAKTMGSLELRKRGDGTGPLFVGSYNIGAGDDIKPWEVEVGNHVTLASNGVTIVAEVTAASNTKYEGKILFFEGCLDEEFKGLRAGDALHFSHDHILTCTR